MKDQIIRNSFRYSFERSLPILIGFFPLGVAFGILMSSVGYNFLWAGLTSLIVYAGSLQFLMVSFFTDETSLVTVAVMALLLNSRHLFYGLSFIETFRTYGPWKYFLIYGMSDESYTLLCSYKDREGVSEKWVHIFSTALLMFYWSSFSALGGLIGTWIPFDTTGIDFALTALFTVIFIEQIKDSPTSFPGVVAIVSSVLCLLLLGPEHFLLPSLTLSVAVFILMRSTLEPRISSGEE